MLNRFLTEFDKLGSPVHRKKVLAFIGQRFLERKLQLNHMTTKELEWAWQYAKEKVEEDEKT